MSRPFHRTRNTHLNALSSKRGNASFISRGRVLAGKPLLERHHAGSKQRVGTSRPASSCNGPMSVFCVDVDAITQGFEVILTRYAWQAAKQLWPDHTVGCPALFNRHMAMVLPAAESVYEAVMLVRLLADEGVIGSRSRAGRAGPVVGRCLQATGSRPLLPNEIVEHWDLIKSTLLLRWSKEAGTDPAGLLLDIQLVFDQVVTSDGGCEPDSWQGSSQSTTPGSSSSSSGMGLSFPATSSSSSGSNSTPGPSPEQGHPTTISSSIAVGLSTSAIAAGGGDPGGPGSSAVLQPFQSVVRALCSCSQPVLLISSYPKEMTSAHLSAAGLKLPTPVQISEAEDVASSLQQLLSQRQPGDSPSPGAQQFQLDGLVAKHPAAAGLADQPVLHVILANPSKVEQVGKVLEAASAGWTAEPSSSGREVQGTEHSTTDQQGCGHSSSSHALPLLDFYVGDWACPSPVLRARAACHPKARLLSEAELAELMGVANLDVVMDGIAWR